MARKKPNFRNLHNEMHNQETNDRLEGGASNRAMYS